VGGASLRVTLTIAEVTGDMFGHYTLFASNRIGQQYIIHKLEERHLPPVEVNVYAGRVDQYYEPTDGADVQLSRCSVSVLACWALATAILLL